MKSKSPIIGRMRNGKKFFIFNIEDGKLEFWQRKGFDTEAEALEKIEKLPSDYLGTLSIVVLPVWTNR